MCWLKLPEGTERPIPQQHHGLQDRVWFAGILSGDKENRIGVRVWGGLVLPKIRQEIAHCLGICVPPLITAARVYGYSLTLGLASGDQQVAQREATKVFGPEVTVVSTRHLQRSRLVPPVYDVEPKGVPVGWEGPKPPTNDTRLQKKSWQKVVTTTIRQQYRSVGKNATLPAVVGYVKPADSMVVDVEATDSANTDLL